MTPFFIKICGITRAEDAETAIDAGATAIGFNFFKESKRYIAPEAAKAIAEQVRGRIATVGVFVNAKPDEVKRIGALVKLTYCQFHGDEDPKYVNRFPNAIKAFRVNDSLRNVYFDEYSAAAFLLDAYDPGEYGGTGRSFNWLLAREANEFGKIILAGGLKPENVADAIDIVHPWGVDVSSGVEVSPGVKDPMKVRSFAAAALASFRQTMEK